MYIRCVKPKILRKTKVRLLFLIKGVTTFYFYIKSVLRMFNCRIRILVNSVMVHKVLFIWKYFIVVTFTSISCIDIVIHLHCLIHNEYVWMIAFCQGIHLKINPVIQKFKTKPQHCL